MVTNHSHATKTFLDISFCYEDWAINNRKEILQQIERANNSEKASMAEEMALNNLFLVRRVADPAFACQVYTEIHNSKESLVSAKKRISHIISSVLDDPSSIKEKLKLGICHAEHKDKRIRE